MASGRRNVVSSTYTLTRILELILCLLVRVTVSDCPPGLDSSTVVVGVGGQQTTLQDALSSLQAPSSANCTRIQLGTGIHHLTQAIHTQQNVVIERHPDSYNDTQPVVRCTGEVGRMDGVYHSKEEPLATISFKNGLYVEISDILFEHCPLPLQFMNVHHLRIEKSSFRYVRRCIYTCEVFKLVFHYLPSSWCSVLYDRVRPCRSVLLQCMHMYALQWYRFQV